MMDNNNDDPLFRPDNKFFNGKVDIIYRSMKERIEDILHNANNYNDSTKAIKILELFHDLIQTYREDYKHH